MSSFDPEVERLYAEYRRQLAAEEAKRRREAAKAIGYIALFALVLIGIVTLGVVRGCSSPAGTPTGSATHLPTATATAQVPQPNTTIEQPQVTGSEPSPAPHGGPDYIGIGTLLGGIGALLGGIAAVVRLRRSREKTPKGLNSTELRVYNALADGQKTTAELHAMVGLQSANLVKALNSLVARGLVRRHRGQGQVIWYQRTDNSELVSGLRTRLRHDRAWMVFHSEKVDKRPQSFAHRTRCNPHYGTTVDAALESPLARGRFHCAAELPAPSQVVRAPNKARTASRIRL